MYRRLGLTIMLLLALFGVFLSQRTVDAKLGYRISHDTVEAWTIECGTTFPIIFDGEYATGVDGRSTRDLCTRVARTRITEIVFVWLLALGFGIAGIKRGPRPPRIPIDDDIGPLPEFVPATHRPPGPGGIHESVTTG